MKTLKLILLVAAFGAAIYYTEAKAQTQFDYLGGLGISANVTGCFYIDLNTYGTNTGVNDVVITYGNGEIYFDDVVGDSMKAPGITTFLRKNFWQDCNISTNAFNLGHVYIKTSSQSLSIGSHVLPFKYNNLYNYLVLRVTTDSVYVRGWVFNIAPENWECYNLEAQKQIQQPIKKEE